MGRIAQAVALGVGAGGAMVDVSTYAKLDDGITRRYGTQSEFDPAAPGQYTFTLDNLDGRFTPDSTAVYATPLTRGTPACWQVDTGSLRAGKVRGITPVFPNSVAAWSKVQVTVEDALGDAARLNLTGTSLVNSMILGAPAYLWFPMDDPAGSLYAREASGNNQIPLASVASYGGSSPVPTFGVTGTPIVGAPTQVELTGSQSGFSQIFGTQRRYPVSYPSGSSLGAWGFWFTPMTAGVNLDLSWYDGQFTDMFKFACTSLAGGMTFAVGTPIVTIASPSLTVGVAHYFAAQLTYDSTTGRFAGEFYMDGVLLGTSTGSTTSGGQTWLGPKDLSVRNSLGGSSIRIQNLTHTPGLINEYATTAIDTEAGWLTTLGLMNSEVKLATLPAGLSTRPIGPVDYQDRALLDLIAEAVLTEQGYLYTQTTGTLLAPVQRVVVRDRARPAAVSYTFDVERDLQGAPDFIFDSTNMVSSVDVDGPLTSVKAADSSLVKKIGSANTSQTIISTLDIDLLAWGQDRLNRGANARLRVQSLKIDAMVLPTATATATIANLLALVPGDRVQLTNLPNTQFTATTWDGWFLGAEETHNSLVHEFVLYFQPVLPDTAIFDTNLWMSGGVHSIVAPGLTAGATSVSIATTDPITVLETAVFPYTLLIDSEQVTVTACTSATPQVATITRGANGTTAVSHLSGSLVEIVPASLYAF